MVINISSSLHSVIVFTPLPRRRQASQLSKWFIIQPEIRGKVSQRKWHERDDVEAITYDAG